MKRFLKLSFVVLILFAGYLLFWPVSIEPLAWEPPENPELNGKYQANDRLSGSERLLNNVGIGPEDIVARSDGLLHTGLLDGRILQFSPDSPEDFNVLTRSERPLGMDFGPDGTLYFVDAYRGLMAYDPGRSEKPRLLSEEAAGQPYGFTNDLAIAPDGAIYFTDSSFQYSVDSFEKIMLAHEGTGRLLRYDPETEQTVVLEAGLQFPNGLVFTADHESLLMVETAEYRVRKFPVLDDGTTGEPEVVLDALPGIPDNINRADDTFWLAMPTPRNSMLDTLGPYPWLRKMVARLPKALHPAPQRHPIVLEITENGEVLRNLQDRTGDAALISSAYPHGGSLYLGSYQEPVLRRHELQ